jgi:hypothetical protein
MPITNPAYLEELKKLKQTYADLPWYQRFWFFIWSNSLHSALFAIELDNPTNKPTAEQIQTLYERATNSWFFQTIFGLLTRFQQAVATLPFVKETPLSKVSNSEGEQEVTPKEQLSPIQNPQNQKPLFQPQSDASQFLHHVTRGNYDEVEKMLKKDRALFTQRGKVTDCSGRTFSNATGFEYALWALDKHMWTRMLNCLPNDEEGLKIKAELQVQYKGIKERGISYSLNGKPILVPEHHFDFKNTLIKELQTQVDAVNEENPNWNAIDKQWKEGVGGAQKLLPMHVVYEYCSNEPFYPKPTFIAQPELKKQFYNWVTGQDENWFGADSKLGTDFAIYKAGVGVAREWHRAQAGCGVALAAITALYEVRTKDFVALESQLGIQPEDTLDDGAAHGYQP